MMVARGWLCMIRRDSYDRVLIGVRVHLPVMDTFSKRQKRLNSPAADVFTYDRLSPKLRIQIVKIWEDALGKSEERASRKSNPAYVKLCDELAVEFGLKKLGSKTWYLALSDFFTESADEEQALDMVDEIFRTIVKQHRDRTWRHLFEPSIGADAAIGDLNARFQEHGVGYFFVAGDFTGLIRKDNEHLHQEITLPALSLLRDARFEGANSEYRNAHEHYGHARYKECLNDALKAFESTMKTICTIQSWPFDPARDTASGLIEICINHGLVPPLMRSSLTTIPTLRNKLSAHGQGAEVKVVPQHLAEYVLHETAATIVLLVDGLGALPE